MPSTPAADRLAADAASCCSKPLARGRHGASSGLTAIPPDRGAGGRRSRRSPPHAEGPARSTGVVWRDFSPGGGTPGKVEQGELGHPRREGRPARLVGQEGAVDATTDGERLVRVRPTSEARGCKTEIDPATFGAPFTGVSWLGPKLITPSIIIAYIWVWAGFAMVVIGAGLAAISREVLEAARTDGASEWQVFRRITVPMLAPVLSVVFITMLINVLKVFDIVISIAPGSTQSDAAVIAVQMWRQSFGGSNDFGLGSAIAVFLFILVIPVLLLNVRRFRREV